MRLTEHQKTVLIHMREKRTEVTAIELREQLGKAPGDCNDIIKRMVDRRMMRRTGYGRYQMTTLGKEIAYAL